MTGTRFGILAVLTTTLFAGLAPAADGTTNIDTATADIFRFGGPAGNGVVRLNVAPFPEPGFSLWAVGACLLAYWRLGAARFEVAPRSVTGG